MYQVGGENWFFRALVPLEAEEEKGGKRGEGRGVFYGYWAQVIGNFFICVTKTVGSK
jgi:hypothetical protein